MPYPTFYNLPEEKREQIIQATVDELFAKGYEKTSIAKIIEKAGIPRGSFYQYFEDKNDLYKYIIVDVIGSKKHESSKGKVINTQNILEVLRQLFIGGIEFYREYPKLAAIATDFIKLKDKELSKKIVGDSEKMSNMYFSHLIEQGKKAGEINENIDAELLIFLIHSVNTTFVDYFIEKANSDYKDDELFHVVDRMLFILQNGIKSN